MESPNIDLNVTSSPTKSDHETSQPTNLKAHSIGRVELHPSCQETLSHSSSTCSSPDSPLVDPFNRAGDDDNSQSFSSNEESSTECAEPSPHRIPSSVFGSKTSPGEWSIASNESLFSIHGDNASFRNEQFLFWRSGELGSPGDHDASTSDHIFSYSDQQPRLCTESMRSCELGLAEATMKEVIRETESNHDHLNHQATSSLAIPSRSSHESSSSITSYAFGIKAGDSQRGDILRTPSSVRSIPEEHAVQYSSPPSPQVMTEPPAQVMAEPPPHCDQKQLDPAASRAALPKKWSFLPCC